MDRDEWMARLQPLKLGDLVAGIVETVTEHEVHVHLAVSRRYRGLRGIIPVANPVNFRADPPRRVLPGDLLLKLKVVEVDHHRQQLMLAMPDGYQERCRTVDLAQVDRATVHYLEQQEDQSKGWLDDFEDRQTLAGFHTSNQPGADGDIDLDNPAEMLYNQIEDLVDRFDEESDSGEPDTVEE